MAKSNNNYNAQSIQVLEGLEAVRKRPGMYIGSTDKTGLHHLVWEILDNAIDEALAGYCHLIKVTLEKDGSITIEDDGRGIPVEKHKTGKPTPEVVFTILHAGGKFGAGAYKVSGGLHGVGASVVNALSSSFNATIYRDHFEYQISFSNGGKLKQKLQKVGSSSKVGTKINFYPDPNIFEETEFDAGIIAERLQESAFLVPGLKIILTNKITNEQETFFSKNGLSDFVKYVVGNKKTIGPIANFEGTYDRIKVKVAFQYTTSYSEMIVPFANNVKNPEGGNHVIGFKTGITKSLNDFAKKVNLIKDSDHLDGSDIREGIVAIISVLIPEDLIQYEGQTKGKLGTSDARFAVDRVMTRQMGFWCQENNQAVIEVLKKALKAREAREAARKARQAIRDSKTKSKTDPKFLGKLTPAQSRNSSLNELFLVEGNSAGGSAKSARDRKYQAILPLRGKVINAEKASLIDLLKNEEINAIINSIGGGIGKDFDVSKINYDKIIIMTDADTDGAHIQALLLTFFYRYMTPLFMNNHIFLALPPLFKVATNKQTLYAWTEKELKSVLNSLSSKPTVQRYKGLGEMNPGQLWSTTMDPEQRKLIRVTLNDAVLAEKQVQILMGNDSQKRREWIEHHINFTLEDQFAKTITGTGEQHE